MNFFFLVGKRKIKYSDFKYLFFENNLLIIGK
jgi:hypothetical protein